MSQLFLPETEEEARKLGTITRVHVRRMEGGKFVYSPHSFEPEALTSIEQVHELFGGGDYMVEGRSDGGVFVKNFRFQLPGVPKSLSLAEQQAKEEQAAAARAPAPPAAAPQSEIGALTQLMMAQMNQTTQILVAILGRGDSASDKLFERRQALEDQARREHTQFLQTVLERGNAAAAAGGGSQESFMQGVEFAQGLVSEMMQRQGEGGAGAGGDDILSTLAQFVQGFKPAMQQQGPPAVTPPGVPNGASVQ